MLNALRKLKGVHRDNLKRMGFDFSATFSKDNGASGKIPVKPEEWHRIGIYSDERAWNLLHYCYRKQYKTFSI